MSTQLDDHGTHWIVKTVAAPGKRRKFGRNPVRVGKSDPTAVRTEIMAQAEAARKLFGVDQPSKEPVV